MVLQLFHGWIFFVKVKTAGLEVTVWNLSRITTIVMQSSVFLAACYQPVEQFVTRWSGRYFGKFIQEPIHARAAWRTDVVVRWTSLKTYNKSTSPISCTICNSHLHGALMIRVSATGACTRWVSMSTFRSVLRKTCRLRNHLVCP